MNIQTEKLNLIEWISKLNDISIIDKFFELLDWDMRNDQGYAEQYREVVREDKVQIKGKQKAPDYSFRVGGQKKFFVEAKKPTVNIKDDIGPAFQVRRYAYSAKLPLSILTDFQEFAIYDTRIKPKATDKASVARIFYCTYDEYLENFEYIYNIFAKSSILKGSFDQYVEENKKKKGTSEVDKEFLKLIESWRSDLAKNIASNNKQIDIYGLNEAVQKIIDRIIFLRIAEDRNIEDYNTLAGLAEKFNIYKSLDEFFKLADKKYNSGLFKIEDWLSNLKIDDKVLKDIINSLYYPKSPYEFSVLPVEILGQIYEQFLGKTIELTKSHQAKIEEKPEVRKAGGVYYTPQYIVDYIVENTVGELIKNKTPEKISEIKVLDPACGSGSFLLGAFNYLLDYHLKYYIQEKNLKSAIKKSKIYKAGENDYKLSINEKRNILLNNIYGVDIDSQAVEVTKLSLLLKLMEDENAESSGQLFKYSDLALLPDLSNNIKCGNSLIGSDFYDGENLSLFKDEAKMRKINVFDWDDKEKGFGDIMANGGFDTVIGNPPYVDYRFLDNDQLNYINNKFESTNVKEKWNLYILFIELGTHLLKKSGLFGYIVPNAFLVSDFGISVRKLLLNNTSIYSLIDVSKLKVFGNVATYPVLLFFKNQSSNNKIKIAYLKNKEDLFINKFDEFEQKKFKNEKLKYIIPTTTKIGDFDLKDKIIKDTIPFKDCFGSIIWGTSITGFKSYKINKAEYIKLSSAKQKEYEKVIQTADIKRYYISWQDEYIQKDIYSKKAQNEFIKIKIVIARVTKKIQATLDDEKYYVGKSTVLTDFKIDPYYFLGLINSQLLNYYYYINYENTHMGGGYLRYDLPYLKLLPIKKKASSNSKNKIIKLVKQMLEVQGKYHSAKSESEKELHKKKIDILDKQIDQEVYKLYGLNSEDVKIIEGK